MFSQLRQPNQCMSSKEKVDRRVSKIHLNQAWTFSLQKGQTALKIHTNSIGQQAYFCEHILPYLCGHLLVADKIPSQAAIFPNQHRHITRTFALMCSQMHMCTCTGAALETYLSILAMNGGQLDLDASFSMQCSHSRRQHMIWAAMHDNIGSGDTKIR